MTSTCWGPCGQQRQPYACIPAATFIIGYFRCGDCDVEWREIFRHQARIPDEEA